MPNLYPGIKPNIGSGRSCVLLFATVFLPFLVFAQPVITNFTPQSGPVGSTVTITGSSFGATPAANIVFFGSVQATVTAASATSLSVTVPPGIAYRPLTVTTGGLTTASALPFITTFADPGQFAPDAFTTRLDINTDVNPEGIFSMDIDGDGKTDLLEVNSDGNTLSIFRNTSTTGNLSFTLAVNYLLPPGYSPVAVTAGDLDGDGKPDIAVCNMGSPKLAVFRNTSTPGNVSIAAPVYYALGNYSTGVTIGDCNGDGKPEIVTCSVADNTVSVFANNSTPGTLNFSTAMPPLALPSGTLPYDVIIADLDGDGKPDLATANAGANTVSVFLNTGATWGALSFAANSDISVGAGPQWLAVGDLDGDGKSDLAVVNYGDATITLLQNACIPGNVNFIRGTDVPTGSMTPGSPWELIMADFDGDGKPDIASINQLDNTVSVHRNTSTVGAPSIAANVDYATGDVPWAITSADFDNDGLPDLAILDNTTNQITLLRNKSSSFPSITSFTPTSGAAGTVVTITGTNLNGATAVSFGGVAASAFTVVSPTTITATVAGGASGVVQVVTPGGSPTLGTFTYGVPPPAISGFTPNSGSPGTMITINGAHFTGATSVNFGSVVAASFTVISDNQISAVVGNGNTGLVTVNSPAGSASLGTFTYVPPTISISSFSPQTGSTGTQVVIRGHGFLNAQSVSFGGVAASSTITINGDTSIVATVAGGASGSVTVTGATSSDSDPGFTFINNTPPPPPANLIAITSFAPASGSAGDTVYIYGTYLTTATIVSFGGSPALAYRALSDSQMLAIVGGGSTGAVRIANNTNADSLGVFTYVYDTTKIAPTTFQLIQFSGALAGNNDPHLQWQVRNDGAIAYYAVERSSDSILFSVIGTVKSTRTNGGSHTYTFADPAPGTGANWYRLKMQDTTAAYTYSSKIKLQPVSQLMPVYPNPVKYGFFYVDIPDVNGTSQIQLFDMSGREIRLLIISPGTITIRVNIPELSAGTYRLNWTNSKTTRSATILVLPH